MVVRTVLKKTRVNCSLDKRMIKIRKVGVPVAVGELAGVHPMCLVVCHSCYSSSGSSCTCGVLNQIQFQPTTVSLCLTGLMHQPWEYRDLRCKLSPFNSHPRTSDQGFNQVICVMAYRLQQKHYMF